MQTEKLPQLSPANPPQVLELGNDAATGYTPDVSPQPVDPEKPPVTSPFEQLRRGEFVYDNPESPDYVRPGDAEGMLRAVTDRYFQAQPEVLPTVRERYAMLTTRDAKRVAVPPRVTDIIPAAIHNESLSNLRDTLKQVAGINGVEQDEVLVYGNMPDNLEDQERAAVIANFDNLLAEQQAKHPHLNLRSVIVEYPPEELTMGRIRHDFTDLVAYDARQRGGFRVDHPVVTFDADTKRISRNANQELARVLVAPDSREVLAHLETGYLFDTEASVNPDGTLPDARKLAILQELRRRQYARLSGPSYNEEWGAAVALGPCLMAGNYNEHHDVSEMHYLKRRLRWAAEGLTQIMQYAKPAITKSITTLVHYLKGVSVQTSGRRQEDFLRHWIAGKLDDGYAESIIRNYVRDGLSYDNGFGHTESLRARRDAQPAVEPELRSPEQARRMVAAVIGPTVVPTVDIARRTLRDTPLPDPAPYLRRLGLPAPDRVRHSNGA